MEKMLKSFCLVITLMMMVSVVFTGCKQVTKETKEEQTESEVAAPGAEELKPVQLIMYLLGDPAKDYDLALEQFNIKLKKDLNATLKVNWLSWGDYETKYPLVLASGEPMDLIYTADWAFFKQQAQKGAFMALNELGPKYAPQSFADEPEVGLKQATVDGKIYALPMNYKEYATEGYFVRGDLMKKAGMTEIKNLDDYGKYLDYVAKNEPEMIPIDLSSSDLGLIGAFLLEQRWISLDISTTFCVKLDDPELKVFDYTTTPEYESFLGKMFTWSKNGYWSKSALSNDTRAVDSFKNGRSASAMWNLIKFNETYMALSATNPEWDVTYFDANPSFSSINNYTMNAMAIPIASGNPERALMLLEKLRTDEAYFNLLTYGIEGKHYNITPEGKLEALDSEGFGPDSSCPWGWRVENFYKDYKESWPGIQAYRDVLDSKLVELPTSEFVLNTEAIKSQLAAIFNVMQQYNDPLLFGLVDPNEYLPQLKEQMKTAGVEKARQDIQNQIDAYLKAK